MIPRNPEDVHAPLTSYVHQIEVPSSARWLVLSGQLGQHPNGSVPEDPIAQVEVALENLSRNLAAANMTVSDVVKLTIYLVGEVDAAARRAVFAHWLDGHLPCMTLLYVSALAAPPYKVELDAWACRATPERTDT
ncbi:RidA family protein [Deinococcus caeni]|uniref:RidA family protein n=1 Tax=Deinococcus caeni TaxID=569127 RepID=A0ABP9UF52_9DEIO